MRARGGAHAGPGRGRGRERSGAGAVGDQLDPDHESALADVAQMRMRSERVGQRGAQVVDLGWQLLEDAVALEQIERGERGGTAERMTGERVAVIEGLAIAGAGAEKLLVDPSGRQRGGERGVPAAQALGQAEQVGSDLLLATG